MIGTVCKISWLRLWNNKQELALALGVPILFFTIFALIFSRGVGQTMSQVRVSFIDDDRTPESQAIIEAACQHAEIKPVTAIGRSTPAWPIAQLSRWLISQQAVEVVVHIPQGFTGQDPDAPTLSITLHNEGINPIGHRLVQASLAEAIALQFAELNLKATSDVRPAPATPPPQSPRATLASARTSEHSSSATRFRATAAEEPQVFRSVSPFANNKHQPKVAMYAAGIAVMFLLFSANAAGASLLEEYETGTLGRLLSSRLSLTQLLAGKWLYATALGTIQLTVMFLWGELVFQVALREHLVGFAAMTLATAAACASFGLFLASICRSRQQLHAVSVVLILSMSAVGGSMVPRYIMSDTMRNLGKFTFNGWALDGFQKVFWYDLPLTALRLELTVLLSIAALLAIAARIFASRWSAA